MWTGKIRSVDKAHGRARVIFIFSSGADSFEEELSIGSGLFDTDAIKQYIANKCSEIEKVYAFADSLITGVPVDTTPKPVPQTEIDKQTFITDFATLQKMQKAIDAGFKTDKDQDFIDLKAKVDSEFKPEYVSNL